MTDTHALNASPPCLYAVVKHTANRESAAKTGNTVCLSAHISKSANEGKGAEHQPAKPFASTLFTSKAMSKRLGP